MHNTFTEQLINTDRNLNRKRGIEREKEKEKIKRINKN